MGANHPPTLLDNEPEPAELPATTGDPMLAMMERLASNRDVDTDKLKALIEMQKDIMSINSKSAFNAAFAKLQAVLPTVIEHGKTNNGRYARLEDIVEAVRPILVEHGFSLSHRTEWPDKGTVKVIGILTHEQGFARESEFMGTADTSGNKNAIQALGSAVSYGRRYTTKDLLNIVTKEEDDDGAKSGNAPAPEGYSDWFDDMEAMVVGGCGWPELEAAWKKSKDSFRAYIAKHDKARVEGWKKKAKSVPS